MFTLNIYRSDIDTLQFQMTFEIPHIRVKAQYRSSGVLILVKASGAGDYWGEYGNLSMPIIFTSGLTAIVFKPFKVFKCIKKNLVEMFHFDFVRYAHK